MDIKRIVRQHTAFSSRRISILEKEMMHPEIAEEREKRMVIQNITAAIEAENLISFKEYTEDEMIITEGSVAVMKTSTLEALLEEAYFDGRNAQPI